MNDDEHELRVRDAFACVGSMVVTLELLGALLRAGALTLEAAQPVLARFEEILAGWDDIAPVVVGKARRLMSELVQTCESAR